MAKPKPDKPIRHLVIPDTQIKPGVPMDHLKWVGQAIVKYHPDRVIHLGDHWDFPSLNQHDKPGSKTLEGARYQKDVEAGNKGFAMLCAPMEKEEARLKGKWKPQKHFIMGNHELRADRAAENDPKLHGTVGSNACNVRDFKWHGFLKRVWIDGICYSHYFQNSHSKFPIGGEVTNRFNKIGASFVQGHEQGFRYGNRMLGSGRTIHGLVAGSCLTPDHKVLTADLRYVALGSLIPGDKLVSFDETRGVGGKSRRYLTGTVEAVYRDVAKCYEVTLGTGKVFKVTEDHQWLTRSMGTTTAWLRTDQFILNNGRTHVPILMDEWEQGHTFDHGWLSGMFDGEGCLYTRTTTGGTCMQLSLSQKPGRVLDAARVALKSLVGVVGYTEVTADRSANTLRIRGGCMNSAKVLGTLRPIRLIDKFRPEQLGRMSIKDWTPVVSIRAIGPQEIVRIAIDAKTMIVEGYGHHNCYLHEEDYRGAQGQHHWRGIVVLNGVINGDYCVMPLTLDYLCREFEVMPLQAYMEKKYPDGSWDHLSMGN